jgi:DNA helicase-2/ATP-dependent DNA helicase PcrA
VLTHALDYGGKRTRRVSPFVLEALDLPAGAAPATRPSNPLERLGSFESPAVAEPAPANARAAEPLVLSFHQVDAYLACPLRYKYAHVLRVPTAPHHAIVYGSALHLAVQQFHKRHARGVVMSEAELIAAFEQAWTTEGFVSREHEEARLEAGRVALRRFRRAQLEPGAVIPAYVEREFAFMLDGDRVRGRMDRVDLIPLGASAGDGGPHGSDVAAAVTDAADVVEPALPLLRERVVITDYKSSDVRDPAKARERARESLQLTIYAMAWQAETGRLPDAVALHFLDSGLVGTAEVDAARVERGLADIREAASGIRAGRFEARPSYMACSWCAFRDICPSSVAR